MDTMDNNGAVFVDRPAARVDPVPWGWREIIAAIVFAAVGILLLNLALVGIGFLQNKKLHEIKDVVAAFLAVQDLVVVGAAWMFGLKRYRVGWNRIGLRPFSVPLGCGLSVLLLILSYLARIIYGVVAMALGFQLQPQEVLSQLDLQGIGFVVTLVAAGVIAPIAEEIFFRGFLYGGMRNKIGATGAMVISTLFFTGLHMTLPLFIPIFLLGLFLAWLYEYTGSLYPGIFLHAANNALSLVLLFILQSAGLMPLQ